MKTPSTLFNACLVVGVATIASQGPLNGGLVEARPMHADMDYQRYLLEKDDIVDELKSWMTKWKDAAKKNGWIPSPKVENATADDKEEDRKQRFFLAKQLVRRLKKENPDADFSTDSPFTLLTTDEFHKFVTNSYIAGGAAARSLREEVAPAPVSGPAPVVGTATTDVRTNDIASALGDYLKRLTGQGNGQVTASKGSSNTVVMAREANFGDWFNSFDWSSLFRPTAAPTARPTSAPAPSTTAPTTTAPTTTAPAPTTTAPTTTVPSTTTPTTTVPSTTVPLNTAPSTTTPAPVPTTTRPAPVPTTTRPAVVPSPNRPVAPIFSPTDTPSVVSPTPSPSGEVSGDGTSLDWSAGKCMPPIQNQGQCGSCWSFASVAAVESAQCIAQGSKGFTKYSEQTLASCDTARNAGCDGGVPQYAMQYIQKNGLCTLADDPYTSSSGVLSKCNTACAKVSTGMKGVQPLAKTEAALLSALDQHPVVIAVQAGNDAWKQYKSGVISACPSAAQVDHAVVAVGYDATTIKIRNSWGPRWGEAGYVRLARSSAGTGTCKMFQQMVHAQF